MLKRESIEAEALQLSPQDRAILIERLIAAFDDGEDVNSEELWLQEAERRYELYRAGKISSKPASVVFREAASKIK